MRKFSLSDGGKLRRENKKKDGVDVDVHYSYRSQREAIAVGCL
jgi:hypothetical protein